MEPISAAFAQHWPHAQCMHLLDDSLSRDRLRDGELTRAMVERFKALAAYAKGTGALGILFTCSAFGPAIEAAGKVVGIPTLKPNEAMFDQALGLGSQPSDAKLRVALIATFEPSISSMSEEFHAMARERNIDVDLQTAHVPGAMDDLAAGRVQAHHRRIADVASRFPDCDAVMLAQFSMAPAQRLVQQQVPGQVLTSPECAVLALRRAMGA